MARTAGVPTKADKKLHGVEIDWTGHPIRDGRGYYGEPGNAPEPPAEGGAFPAIPVDDVSRRRFSPAEALKAAMREQAPAATPISNVSQVRIVGGVQQEPVAEKPPDKSNSLKKFWARLKTDPAAFAAWKEKVRNAKKKGKG